jgi:hypothetical protein
VQWQDRGKLLLHVFTGWIAASRYGYGHYRLITQIFPVTYVEALAEPTPAELQEEAQEEAKVFASLGECNEPWSGTSD